MSLPTSSTTVTLDLDEQPVPVSLTRVGTGRPVLLLHGGGGPQTVVPWASTLAGDRPADVVAPVHPGFAGTPRPDGLDSIPDLARLYVTLLEHLDLNDVVVVGNSIGAWVAAEMAVLAPGRVSGYALVDAVGVEVDGHPIADFFSLTPAELAQLSYADPATYGIDPATLPPEVLAVMPGNRSALETYAGRTMADPTLLSRLSRVSTPTLVVWGEADRIADADYGRALADAIPGARFELVTGAGHLPQVETPDLLVGLVWSFADEQAGVCSPTVG